MKSAPNSGSMPAPHFPTPVQDYLDAVVTTCARDGHSLVSLLVFGSAAKGGRAPSSDVDLIIVVPDGTSREERWQLREAISSLEVTHGFRSLPTRQKGALEAFIEHAGGRRSFLLRLYPERSAFRERGEDPGSAAD